jgi:hypothetical protein
VEAGAVGWLGDEPGKGRALVMGRARSSFVVRTSRSKVLQELKSLCSARRANPLHGHDASLVDTDEDVKGRGPRFDGT